MPTAAISQDPVVALVALNFEPQLPIECLACIEIAAWEDHHHFMPVCHRTFTSNRWSCMILTDTARRREHKENLMAAYRTSMHRCPLAGQRKGSKA